MYTFLFIPTCLFIIPSLWGDDGGDEGDKGAPTGGSTAVEAGQISIVILIENATDTNSCRGTYSLYCPKNYPSKKLKRAIPSGDTE